MSVGTLGKCRAAVLLAALVAAPGLPAVEDDFASMNLEQLMQVAVVVNPVSALNSHLHRAGDRMLGYHYMPGSMGDLRDGSGDVSTVDVLADYGISPTRMDMSMHMFHLMYAPSDELTLSAIVSYHDMRMKHVTRSGRRFTTEASGWGDTTISANRVLSRTDSGRLSLLAGLSLPTGSIDKKDHTPAGRVRLPYPMQLGSGTWDVRLGLNYQWLRERWIFGLEGLAMLRTGENDNGYTLGNTWELSAWYSRAWSDSLTIRLTLDALNKDDIDGADPDLVASLVPTADPNLGDGTRLDLGVDIEWHALSGRFKGQNLAVGYKRPVYQHLDGPVLAVDWNILVGWQWVF